MKKIFGFLIVFIIVITGSSCSSKSNYSTSGEISIKDFGVLQFELYEDIAPRTVANFQKLVSEGFYDGLTFHRVINGFMIQGGDPNGDGTGGSSEKIVGEFLANGYNNTLSHTRGVISMARSLSSNNSASSQFFIMQSDGLEADLDGLYAAFGKIISGMEIVDTICNLKTDENNKPVEEVVIEYIKLK